MLIATYQRGTQVYQNVAFEGEVPLPKRGYVRVALEYRPSCMDTARGRSNCTRQIRTMTRKQKEPASYCGGILCS